MGLVAGSSCWTVTTGLPWPCQTPTQALWKLSICVSTKQPQLQTLLTTRLATAPLGHPSQGYETGIRNVLYSSVSRCEKSQHPKGESMFENLIFFQRGPQCQPASDFFGTPTKQSKPPQTETAVCSVLEDETMCWISSKWVYGWRGIFKDDFDSK